MEYSMNMYAKLLHTSISRIGSGGNIVKIYGNHTDFHIAYVVKKYREEKKDAGNSPYLVNLCQGVTTAVVEDSNGELYLIGPVSFVEYEQADLKKFMTQECGKKRPKKHLCFRRFRTAAVTGSAPRYFWYITC